MGEGALQDSYSVEWRVERDLWAAVGTKLGKRSQRPRNELKSVSISFVDCTGGMGRVVLHAEAGTGRTINYCNCPYGIKTIFMFVYDLF